MNSRFKTPALRRWLCPLLTIVIILAMSPAALAATAPAALADLGATPGNKQVALSWTAPDSGGSDITDYQVQYKLATAATYTPFVDGVSPITGAVVTGLVNGTRYQFRVRAVNAIGNAPWTGVFSTPAGAAVPGALTDLTATPGYSQVTLGWTAPPNGGSDITDYEVQYKLATAATYTPWADAALRG